MKDEAGDRIYCHQQKETFITESSVVQQRSMTTKRSVSLKTIVNWNREGVEFTSGNGNGGRKVHFHQDVAMINLVKTNTLQPTK